METINFCVKNEDLVLKCRSPENNENIEWDIERGVFLLNKLIPQCDNCGVYKTPQWRKGWVSDTLGSVVLLCNACGLKFHKNQNCNYCNYLIPISKNQDELEKSFEIVKGCIICKRKVHRSCLEKLNKDNIPFKCDNCNKIELKIKTNYF